MNREQRRAAEAAAKRLERAGAVDLAAHARNRAEPTHVVTLAYCRGTYVTGLFMESLLACAARSAGLGLTIRPVPVQTGVFGAYMLIDLTADGPVTLHLVREGGRA